MTSSNETDKSKKSNNRFEQNSLINPCTAQLLNLTLTRTIAIDFHLRFNQLSANVTSTATAATNWTNDFPSNSTR